MRAEAGSRTTFFLTACTCKLNARGTCRVVVLVVVFFPHGLPMSLACAPWPRLAYWQPHCAFPRRWWVMLAACLTEASIQAPRSLGTEVEQPRVPSLVAVLYVMDWGAWPDGVTGGEKGGVQRTWPAAPAEGDPRGLSPPGRLCYLQHLQQLLQAVSLL